MKGKLLMYSVLLYMVGELLLGGCVGLVVKYVARFGATQSSDTRVFVAKDYSSTYFGKNFPRAAFDPFQFPREFIIVQYVNDEVVSEEFFTFLGDSTKAIYQNGQYRGHGYSVLSSPVYFFTVLIPIMLGFFTAFLPFVGEVGMPLLISGLIWMFLTFLPMLLFTFGDRS
jgi:hypothetical protein